MENGTPVVVISTGDLRENDAKAQEYRLAQILLQEAFEVAEAYRVFGSPGAVLVDEAGAIASERASGARSVSELLQAVSSSPVRLIDASADEPVELAVLSAR